MWRRRWRGPTRCPAGGDVGDNGGGGGWWLAGMWVVVPSRRGCGWWWWWWVVAAVAMVVAMVVAEAGRARAALAAATAWQRQGLDGAAGPGRRQASCRAERLECGWPPGRQTHSRRRKPSQASPRQPAIYKAALPMALALLQQPLPWGQAASFCDGGWAASTASSCVMQGARWRMPALTASPPCGHVQVLDGAELDFSRYGDTLFEVFFVGGRLATGASVAAEGKRTPVNVSGSVNGGGLSAAAMRCCGGVRRHGGRWLGRPCLQRGAWLVCRGAPGVQSLANEHAMHKPGSGPGPARCWKVLRSWGGAAAGPAAAPRQPSWP